MTVHVCVAKVFIVLLLSLVLLSHLSYLLLSPLCNLHRLCFAQEAEGSCLAYKLPAFSGSHNHV